MKTAEAAIAGLEARLAALGEALRAQQAEAIEAEAAGLQAALEALRREARPGTLTPPLRRRLAAAASRVEAQRDALARAGAALGRALQLLLPAAPGRAYSPAGLPERAPHGGAAQA